MYNLAGKTALITGGSRGIGSVIAMSMARYGAKVAITYKSSKKEAVNIQSIIENDGGECILFEADITIRTQMELVINSVSQRWGKLDILVNNAGINKPTDLDQISDDDWDEILAVNLKGPFICVQLAIPLLKESGNASVIQIGSVSGQYGGPRTAHYAASKAGLISLSQVIARFGAAYGIRSNTIAAGILSSDMGNAGLASPVVMETSKNILLGHLGSFEDIAAAAIFLASDNSKYITAQTINVNGGLYF